MKRRWLGLLALLVLAWAAPAAHAQAQYRLGPSTGGAKCIGHSSSATPAGCTLSQAPQGGVNDLMVIRVAWGLTAGATLTSVKDSAGNSATCGTAGGTNPTLAGFVTLCYAFNPPTSITSYVAAFSGTIAQNDISVFEAQANYSGTATFDAAPTPGTGTTGSINNPTTNQAAANELVVCGAVQQHSINAVNGNWILDPNGKDSDGGATEYQLVTPSSTGIPCGFTVSTNGDWNSVSMAFKINSPSYGSGYGANTPAHVQSVATPSGQTGTQTSIFVPVSNPAGTRNGNCGVVFVRFNSAGVTSVTASDANFDTFHNAFSPSYSGTNDKGTILYGTVSGGNHGITVTFGGANPSKTLAVYHEFGNASCVLDLAAISNKATGTTSVTDGGLTTLAANDMVENFWCNDSPGYVTAAFSSLSGTAIDNDLWGGCGAQYTLKATAGAITSTATMPASGDFFSITAAFLAATQGTAAPSGFWILHTYAMSGFQTTIGTTSQPFAFPSSAGGSLAILRSTVEGAITAISDNQSNTYQIGTMQAASSLAGGAQYAYVCAPTLGPGLTGTLTQNSSIGTTSADDIDIFIDPVGVNTTGGATGCFDGTANANGDNTTTDVNDGASYTPNSTGVLVFAMEGVNAKTLTSVTPGTFISGLQNAAVTTSPFYENNGWAIYEPASTAMFQMAWTANGTTNNWQDMLLALKPASSFVPQSGVFLPGP